MIIKSYLVYPTDGQLESLAKTLKTISHCEVVPSTNAMYPDFKGFVDSTAAARLNGFVSSRGTVDMLKEEFEGYGIPLDDLKSVLRI